MRLFSGIQPTGLLHIGNYLGAIKNWVDLQKKYSSLFCIVDYHAITLPQKPRALHQSIIDAAAIVIACGIDPERSPLFIQSHVSAHTELTWILNCFIPMGWMERMTQFKEKVQKGRKERVSVGLFDYPALMAADILLYQTDVVPVGEDQKQHVELTRDVAQRFNNQYGKTFTIPKAITPKAGSRIMGLDNAGKKMSKSEKAYGHAIFLLDSVDDIQKKIMGATTDSLREVRFDEKRAEMYNLLTIYELFTNKKRKDIEKHFEGKGYADFKQELAQVVIEGLRPIVNKYKKLTSDTSYLYSVLEKGADTVRPIARKTLENVKNKIGLL